MISNYHFFFAARRSRDDFGFGPFVGRSDANPSAFGATATPQICNRRKSDTEICYNIGRQPPGDAKSALRANAMGQELFGWTYEANTLKRSCLQGEGRGSPQFKGSPGALAPNILNLNHTTQTTSPHRLVPGQRQHTLKP